MSITTIIEVFIGLLAALGGFEFIKYILNRKSEKRKAQAQADIIEREADRANVELTDSKYQNLIDELQEEILSLREQNKECQDRMKDKSDVINSLQLRLTELVKDYQSQMEEKEEKITSLLGQINDLTSEIIGLTFFKCVKVCQEREPS